MRSQANVTAEVRPPAGDRGGGSSDDLRSLGVEPGQTPARARLAPVARLGDGGAQTVVSALREAVGPTGHVVVPTGTEAELEHLTGRTTPASRR